MNKITKPLLLALLLIAGCIIPPPDPYWTPAPSVNTYDLYIREQERIRSLRLERERRNREHQMQQQLNDLWMKRY